MYMEKIMEERKSLKQYCKEAKKRLKTGFWKNYHNDLNEEIERAEQVGINATKVRDYYANKFENTVKVSNTTDEDFYKKVKELLDTEGEVSNAIGRLTDKDYFNSLSYDERQRYTLSLSERYVKAVERYKKEKSMELTV